MIDIIITLLVLWFPGSADYDNNEWRYNDQRIACADTEDSKAHMCADWEGVGNNALTH